MKKIFLGVFILLFLFTNVYASELGHNSDGYERNSSNNYGVKKKIDINSSNMSNITRTPYVDSSIKIYDYVDILTP